MKLKTRVRNDLFLVAAIAFAVVISTPHMARAQQASFQGLGGLTEQAPDGMTIGFFSRALGVSADGSTVVGESTDSDLRIQAFRWTTDGGMQNLGGGGFHESVANGTSANGNTVVGQGRPGISGFKLGAEAFRWTSDGGMQGLGVLPGDYLSVAYATSANGETVVGYSRDDSGFSDVGFQAFRWTTDGSPMQGLGFLDGAETRFSKAYATSANGNTVVGESSPPKTLGLKKEAFCWTSDGGMQGLGVLTGGHLSVALDVSANGETVVGFSDSDVGEQAFRWTPSGGMKGLGDGRYKTFSVAFGVSADGGVVVGRFRSRWGDEAFIWDSTSGMRSLQDVLVVDYGLVDHGLEKDLLAGSWTLLEATGISDDGRVIVGYGLNPQGNTEAWRAVLGPANTGPTAACPKSVSEECVNGGARVLLSAEVFDADGDTLTVQWHITYPDGSTTTVNDLVTFANPPAPVTIDLADHDFFPHGESRVTLRVSDGIAEAECCSPISITVEDTTAPVIMTMMELIEVGNDPGKCFATVDLDSPESPYRPVFSDLCSPNVSAQHDAPATFPIGETIMNWTVDDGHGNLLYVSQTVIVSDTEAPTGEAPADLVIGHDPGECVATLVDLGTPIVSDNCGVDSITNDAPAAFPLGETEVTWYVSDAAGNTIILTQRVTVTNADPIADAGPDQVHECSTASGHEVTLNGTASWDPDVGDVLSYRWEAVDITFDDPESPTPTAMFPLGSWTVQLTVTDQCGGWSSTDLLVIVQDTTAPQIQAAVVDKPVLWPPNHDMIPVELDLLVSDNCASPENLFVYCEVDSNELDDGTGDGAFTGDVNFADGYSQPVEVDLVYNADTGRWEGLLHLRAERDGSGDGRKYSIRCIAMDASGNATYATVCVTVPKSMGRK